MKKKPKSTALEKIKPAGTVEVIPKPQIKPTNVLQQYIQEVAKYPILSREEEKELSILYYNKKDKKALKRLVQSNLRFVVKIASQYSQFGSKLIDLIQEGNIGLLKAVNEFNPYKGVRLISYAVWWIKGAIQEYLMKQHSIVRIGTTPTQKKLFYLLRKEKLPNPGTPIDTLLLSDRLGIPQKEIVSMQTRLKAKDISLDVHPQQNSCFDVQKNEPIQLDEQYINHQEIQFLRKSIKKLQPQMNKKELYILKHRILSEEPKTLQEIGQNFNVTRESIRQIESKLIKKIKEQVSAHMTSP